MSMTTSKVVDKRLFDCIFDISRKGEKMKNESMIDIHTRAPLRCHLISHSSPSVVYFFPLFNFNFFFITKSRGNFEHYIIELKYSPSQYWP